MQVDRLARTFRAVRLRLRLRQADVAKRAGVSAAAISRIERGLFTEVSFATLMKVADALEIRLEIVARWRGGDLDRMLNAKHSALAEDAAAWILARSGWEVRPEVSFNLGGERGFVDLMAWHAATQTLLVVELKTEIVDVGELLGTFERKRRLAWRIGASIGWRPDVVGVCVLVREGRTNRRRVAAHERTLRAALPDDGRQLRAFLDAPGRATASNAASRSAAASASSAGPAARANIAALAFVPDRQQTSTRRGSATTRRVRVPRSQPVQPPASVKSVAPAEEWPDRTVFRASRRA